MITNTEGPKKKKSIWSKIDILGLDYYYLQALSTSLRNNRAFFLLSICWYSYLMNFRPVTVTWNANMLLQILGVKETRKKDSVLGMLAGGGRVGSITMLLNLYHEIPESCSLYINCFLKYQTDQIVTTTKILPLVQLKRKTRNFSLFWEKSDH